MQGFSTFTSSPYYHTIQDLPVWVDELSLERVSAYARDAVLGLQDVPPEALRLQEVPKVEVTAPASAGAGAAVAVEVKVTGTLGEPLTGLPVSMLVNQNDHWPVVEGMAKEVGGGVYRYTIPAGATDADVTSLTATVNRTEWIAEGYARVDQRAGGVAAPAARSCSSRRVVRFTARRGLRQLRAKTSAGRVRIRGRTVVLDLRKVGRRTVKVVLSARNAKGRTVRQTRTFRTCVSQRSLRLAVGG